MEWHDLEKMTVVQLREDAHEKGMKGVHGLNKAQLLHGLAEILGIEKPHEELSDDVSHSKSDLKHQIRDLKLERAKYSEAHDHKGLKQVRRQIHGLKRKIRKMHLVAHLKAASGH